METSIQKTRVKQEAVKAKHGAEPAPLVRRCLETYTCTRTESPVDEVRGDTVKQKCFLFAAMPHAFFLVTLSMWVELVEGK